MVFRMSKFGVLEGRGGFLICIRNGKARENFEGRWNCRRSVRWKQATVVVRYYPWQLSSVYEGQLEDLRRSISMLPREFGK